MSRAIFFFAMATFLAPALARGDTLTLKDGRILEGNLVSQDADKVVFTVRVGAAKVAMEFDPTKVASIVLGPLKTTGRKPTTAKTTRRTTDVDLPAGPVPPPIVKYDGPTYYLIPLHGNIGEGVVAKLLEEALKDALKRKPDVVILEVDSPGGMVVEAEKIVTVIRRYNKKLRIVSYIDKAESAAVVCAFATREIYMSPSAKMGAATAWVPSLPWLPDKIEEKMQSSWRATARIAAETGGHSVLLAEAMIDRNMELYVVEQDGNKVVKRGKGGKGRTVVSRKGQILTMTAREAAACGLSAGTVGGYDDLAKKLGFAKWTECKGIGPALAQYWVTVNKRLKERAKKLFRDFTRNMEQAAENRPEDYKYTYFLHTGRLTGRSQKRWRERSTACAKFYRRAAKNIGQIMALTQQFKELEVLTERLEERQHEVKAMADRVSRNRTNYDVKNAGTSKK